MCMDFVEIEERECLVDFVENEERECLVGEFFLTANRTHDKRYL